MPIVGDATIVVRAITDKVRGDIERAFKDAIPAAQAAGREHARAYGDAFSNELSGSMSKTFNESFSGGDKDVENVGREHARTYGKSFNSELGNLDLGNAMSRAMRSAENAMVTGGFNAATTTTTVVERTVTRGFSNAGRSGGNAFTRALQSEFGKSAMAASEAFTKIYAIGQIAGVGISVLISAISAVVSGLFSMASAAAQAVGALAVLPGLMSIAAQAAGTLKLAFSGVGKALSLGLKDASASASGAGSSAASAAQEVADAQKALARARQSAAFAASDAAERVANAERDVYEAQQNVLAVQKELNDARKQAAEDLQQLAFSAEDAGLAEQRASLNLKDAYEKLKLVQNLPPDNRARQEAELSYKEAELAYREAKDRSNDLAKEQKKATKAGIEGSDAVVSVRQRIADAQQQLADKERALADARQAQARTALENAQSIADAEERLNRARQEGTASQNAYNQALARLSKPAQNFVKYLVSIRGRFKELKSAIGEELFPKLQQAIQADLNGKALPTLQKNLKETASLLGEAALGVSAVFDKGSKNRLGQLLAGNNKILGIFTERGKQGENTFSKLVRLVLRLGVAIQPLTTRFATWVKSLIDGWEAATRTSDGMSKLTGFFNKAGDRAALLGDIFKHLFGVIKGLGKAADPAGVDLLTSLDNYLADLSEWIDKASSQKKLTKYFDDVATNMKSLGNLARTIGRVFGGLGDNQGVSTFATDVQPAIENIGTILDRMTSNGGGLAEFFNLVSEIAVALTDSGSIKTFFNVINGALKLLIKTATKVREFLDWIGKHSPIPVDDLGKKIFIGISLLTAFHRALAILGFVGKSVFKILAGGILNMGKNITKVTDKIKKFFGKGTPSSKGEETTTTKTTTTTTVTADKAATEAAGKEAGHMFMVALAAGMEESGQIFANALRSVINMAATELRSRASALGKDIITGINIGMRTATPGLGPTLAARVRAAAPEIRAAAEKLAVDLIRGLSAGIRAGGEQVDGAVRGLARSLIAAIKLQLGIKSPSTVFAEIGRDSGRGLVVGLEAEVKAANTAGRELGLAAAKGARSVPIVPAPVTGAVGAEAGAVGAVGAVGAAGNAEKAAAEAASVASKTGKFGRVASVVTKPLGLLVKGFSALSLALLGVEAPIALIIGAIVLLVVGLVALYKHSPQFKKFVDTIVGKLKDLGKWIGNILEKYVLPLLDNFFGWLNKHGPQIIAIFGKVFGFIIDVGKQVISFIKDHWATILIIFTGPIGAIVVFVIKHWATIKEKTEALFGAIGKAISTAKERFKVLKNAVGSVVDWIVDKWKAFRAAMTLLSNKVGQIKEDFKNAFKVIGDWVGDKIQWIQDKLDAFLEAFRNLPDKLRALAGIFKDAGGAIIGALLNGLKSAGDFIGGIAGGIWDAVKNLLNGGIDKINSALEFRINLPFGKHVTIDPPDIPHLAKGGIVSPTAGGTLAVIGEAGSSERVEPLDSEGFSKRDRKMLEMIKQALAARPHSNGDTYVVHPSQGMNENELAQYIYRKNRFGRKIGA